MRQDSPGKQVRALDKEIDHRLEMLPGKLLDGQLGLIRGRIDDEDVDTAELVGNLGT